MSSTFSAFDQEIERVAEDELSEERLLEMLDRIRVRKEMEQLDVQVRRQLRRTIEALLFASSEPLSFRKIREVTDTLYPVRPKVLLGIIQELRDEYLQQERAFLLEEMANGFILRVHDTYSPYVEQLYRSKRSERLSPAATEVLAIVAYRQPVTRGQIDRIRGVDSSGTLAALQERGLVHVTGRLDAPGRPSLYSVTDEFLRHYGYRNVTELPRLYSDEELANEGAKPQPDPVEPDLSEETAPTEEAEAPPAAEASSQNASPLPESDDPSALDDESVQTGHRSADAASDSEPPQPELELALD